MFSYAILFSLCHYFGNKIIVPFFQAFTQFITCITADVDFFTDFSNRFGNDLLDRLEDQYADEEIDENSDDVVIDHDLEDITDDSDVLEKLGIDPDEAQYAPDPEQEYGDEDDEAETRETEETI